MKWQARQDGSSCIEVHVTFVLGCRGTYRGAPMLILLLAMAANPPEDIVIDRCDVIELNHYYDGDGKKIFDQVIFWRWQSIDAGQRLECRDWVIRRPPQVLSIEPRPNGDKSVVWTERGRGALLRRVEAPMFRETWTQFDPELKDRENRPVFDRRRLAYSPNR